MTTMLHFSLQRQALLRRDEAEQQKMRVSPDARVLGVFDDKLPMLAAELFRPLQAFDSHERAERIASIVNDVRARFAELPKEPRRGAVRAALVITEMETEQTRSAPDSADASDRYIATH